MCDAKADVKNMLEEASCCLAKVRRYFSSSNYDLSLLLILSPPPIDLDTSVLALLFVSSPSLYT